MTPPPEDEEDRAPKREPATPSAPDMSSHAAPEGPSIRVLLVEDDARLARLTQKYLEGHGLSVAVAPDGRVGLDRALREGFDLVLLDLMLPGMEGLEVCRAIRARLDVPIIVITARHEEADRVLGLELGADDYVPKPFSPRELLARVRAQVRRARGLAGPVERRVVSGRLVLDAGSLTAEYDGRPLALTSHELALLRIFVERPGRVLGRDLILELLGTRAGEVVDRSIDVHVSRIRQKLGDDPKQPKLLKTIRGLGYVWVGDG
jgi:DNA-binding response OmpR family regulator